MFSFIACFTTSSPGSDIPGVPASVINPIFLPSFNKFINVSVLVSGVGIIEGEIVFDFPNTLYVEKGLSVNDKGEILFVGGSGTSKNEHLYKYAEGTVTLVDDSLKTCDFINIE